MKKSSTLSKCDISIVIVNYNTGNILTKCLDSIYKTTNNLSTPKSEIIAIDNASTDNSFTSLKEKRSLKFIQNSQNVGFAKAVNQGIKKAKSKHVLLLNPDTEVRPEAINTLLEFAQTNPDAGVIGARLVNPDGSTQPSVFHLPTLIGAIKEYWFGVKNSFSKYIPQGKTPTQVEALVMAAFLITPKGFKRVGLLNEKFFMYFEDLDYCKRIRKAGLKIYYLPNAEIIHYHGVSGKSLADQKDQWRRLVPSSKIYHGKLNHYLINSVLWSAQKWQRLFSKT
ncbi:MAG: hypothetical protein A3H88_01070 [Candidatus Blackburnbacteria bacterium RIFCSPLOWO2_02_FULL_44_9]|uniref:Glycosyltransferase 2-like domain-containing protein n=1 Tax=Candidatus Blackburnbacteria bacterium RIFCSPHIGHO2_02_FULL_44_20 TaxID=1797516 RepID=A0A1G1V8N5_9BACT|nr:MAG: hypothetical protein A3E16_00980 [Candidatus Blackburnbacteria bacterium RIFCSPHIGHO2_12_FULL_44_25]OGY11779.1 MAG: hypothetical protein A3D26_01575 [Candidatus Blackburnbacteria bacterium RIFCSPHIGHO2_02_FULL_44_20]OGY15973.1 MAG: hypothetical protein A3H88_01070 [Candidatus Blackburnbacteria bacterium RIFCSPLOWO2_02_FULL_44_9]